MDFGNCYFSTLPIEMIEAILRNLSANDIGSFLEAYPQCAQITANFTNLDLSNYYDLADINGFLKKRYFRPQNIITLNINNVYWITAYKIRKCLLKFRNLKNLYAVQTKLCLRPDDIKIYQQMNLEKLALSFSSSFWTTYAQQALPTIRTLYLFCRDVLSSSGVKILKKIFFANLNSIWICYPVREERCCRFKYLDLRINSQVSDTQAMEVPESTNPHWAELLRYDFKSMFSYKDIQLLTSGQIQFDSMHLKELSLINIAYNRTEHTVEFIKLTQRILLTPQVKQLAKLSVPSCFLYENDEPEKHLFKKRMRLNKVPATTSIGQLIFQHLNGLQVLEISHCNICPVSFFLPSLMGYKFIALCKGLERLRIDVSVGHGAFLENILKECTLIKQLFLRCNKTNNLFVANVSESIGFAKNLEDFHYANTNIGFDEFNSILDGLCLIQSKNLKRILVSFPSIIKFEKLLSIERFLHHHSQIIFFYLNCTLSVKLHQQMKIWLKSFQSHPAQYFTTKIDRPPLPLEIHPHLVDLMYNLNTVACSTGIEEFYKCVD